MSSSFLIYNNDYTNKSDFIKNNLLLKLRGKEKSFLYERDNIKFIYHTNFYKLYNHENNIICLFDGRIYNYKDFSDNYMDSGECIIPLYLKYGIDYIKYLDGEFGIIIFDFINNKYYLSSDFSGTKPIFYSIKDNKLGISTFKSCLNSFELENISRIKPNITLCYNLLNNQLLNEITNYNLELREYKNNYLDFFKAIEKSIIKRCFCKEEIFISLSSGYDSGLIGCILNKLKIKHNIISLNNGYESLDIIKKRINLSKNKLCNINKKQIIVNTKKKDIVNNKFKCFLENIFENNFNVCNISYASVNLLNTAYENNFNVHIAGVGADLITCALYGERILLKSDDINLIEKYLPTDENLKKQAIKYIYGDYINKTQLIPGMLIREELIGSIFSIENRYPFLDKDVIQEFIYLEKNLKYSKYKAPIYYYLKENNYPIDENKKIGLLI